METKTYGKFADNFDYYTVEETGYFGGECLGGNELLRTAHFEDAMAEFVRQGIGMGVTYADEPDAREEYDWGLCYTWTDPGGRMVVSITGRTE